MIKRKLDYKWVIVALCVTMMFFGLGFCSSSKSVYLTAMTDALGISRSAFSVGDSCRYIASAVLNIFFGVLVHKFGTKRLIGAGMLALIASCVAHALAENVWLIYLAGALLGVGFSWTSTAMVGLIVPRWCKKNTGTIMGFVFASNAVGGAVSAQIMTPIIYQEGMIYGYRQAYWLIAAILALATVLILILYRERPPIETAEEPAEESKKEKHKLLWTGLDGHTTKTRPYFYLALICVAVTGMILQNVGNANIANLQDLGIDNGFVATVVSITSVTLALAKILVGSICDKRGLRFAVNLCYIAAVMAMVCQFMIANTVPGKAAAVLYAVAVAVATPLDTIMLPLLAGGLFGERIYVKILGLFSAVYVAGCAVGAPLIHLVYDLVGSYLPVFIASATVMVLIFFVYQYIFHAAVKDRKAIEAQ